MLRGVFTRTINGTINKEIDNMTENEELKSQAEAKLAIEKARVEAEAMAKAEVEKRRLELEAANRNLLLIVCAGAVLLALVVIGALAVYFSAQKTGAKGGPVAQAQADLGNAPTAQAQADLGNAPTKFLLPGGVSLEMVKIKAGMFLMGSPWGEKGHFKDEDEHRVTISKPFLIGKYEVTQKQYQAVMGDNPSHFKGEDRPVEKVSWNDANLFCDKLNELLAKELPKGYRFDLPTEAQWEYACRAGTNIALNNGRNLTCAYGLCPDLDEVGWFDKNSGGHSRAVGEERPNAWGLYDMHGNVWEWCRD